jgi:uncharacterized protein
MKYVVFRDQSKEWRWRLKADNGESIAVSGEGYVNKQDCIYAIQLVKSSIDVPVYQKSLLTGKLTLCSESVN